MKMNTEVIYTVCRNLGRFFWAWVFCRSQVTSQEASRIYLSTNSLYNLRDALFPYEYLYIKVFNFFPVARYFCSSYKLDNIIYHPT